MNSHRTSYIFLTSLFALIVLSGIFRLPIIDRDEPRFAQASKQMMESGNYIDIRFQEEVRYKKPAGIYWLQVLSAKTFGQQSEIWVYRIPSFLGALLAVLITYRLALELFGSQRSALSAALLFGLNPMLLLQAISARADAALLATILAAQLCLARAYLGRPCAPYAFWLALAASILIKGPIGPLVVGLTILSLVIWERKGSWLRALRPLTGLALCVACVLPWFLAIQKASGGAFMEKAVGQDFLPKLFEGQESHGAPPGYYFLTTFLLFPPLLFLLRPTWQYARSERSDARVRFLLAWLVPAWLLFELVPTKLPHYVLPLMTPLVLLAAQAQPRVGRVAAVVGSVTSVLIAGLICGASWFLLGSVLWSAGLLGIAFVGLTVLAARRSAISLALTASALFFAGLVTVVLPALEPMWVYKKVAAELQGREYSQIAFVGFEEPSAIFTFGTHTQLLDAEAAAQLLADDPSAVVIEAVRDGKEPSLATPESSTFDGFNYARGQHLRFYIAENTLSSSSAG